jgi:putative tricarboxylic transport membrane protein
MIAPRTADQAFAAAMLVLGAYIVRNALVYGYTRDGVPGPGFFPLWIGLGLVVLSAANLVRSLRGREVLASEFDVPTLVKTVGITTTVLLFVVASRWLGMLVAIGVAIPAIAFTIQPRGTARFAVTIGIMAVVFPVLAYFLFAVYLRVPLVRGLFGF